MSSQHGWRAGRSRRRVDGWRKIVAVLSPHSSVAQQMGRYLASLESALWFATVLIGGLFALLDWWLESVLAIVFVIVWLSVIVCQPRPKHQQRWRRVEPPHAIRSRRGRPGEIPDEGPPAGRVSSSSSHARPP
jgi:hypothetical protein